MPKTALVTVGSTSFDDLVAAVLDDRFLSALSEAGYATLVVQHGRCTRAIADRLRVVSAQLQGLASERHMPSTGHTSGALHTSESRSLVEVQAFDYTPDLRSCIERSSLVISHAGAGSVLEVLSPADASRGTSSLRSTRASTQPGATSTPAKSTAMSTSTSTPRPSSRSTSEAVAAAGEKILIVVPNQSLMDNHQVELAQALAHDDVVLSCGADATALAGAVRRSATFTPKKWPQADGRRLDAVIDEELAKLTW